MSVLTIYDCDGTLIDSERIVAQVCLEVIHGLGLSDWTMDQYVSTFVGMPGEVGWAAVRSAYGKDFSAGFNDAVDLEINRRLAETDIVLPGVRDAILAIGGMRCVASSSGPEHLRLNIGRAGLQDLFEGNVFSAKQVSRAKPAPDVFLFAACQMGHDPMHCLVIEDSVPGVLAARRAGMQVIGYTGAAHNADIMQRNLREAGAFEVVGHMDALPAVVRGLRGQS
ncbi:MAG: HAD family hydrolase [Beijerinckiaceae bacterium]